MHRHTVGAVVAVAKNVEVQGETGRVYADFREDALLGEASVPVAGASDLLRVPERVELDVPVPGLHPEAAPIDLRGRGRALARRTRGEREDLGARVERNHLRKVDTSGLGDALELGDHLGSPPLERSDGALNALALKRFGHAEHAKQFGVLRVTRGKRAAQRFTARKPQLTPGRARKLNVQAFWFGGHLRSLHWRSNMVRGRCRRPAVLASRIASSGLQRKVRARPPQSQGSSMRCPSR